jgi:hypothetical protein
MTQYSRRSDDGGVAPKEMLPRDLLSRLGRCGIADKSRATSAVGFTKSLWRDSDRYWGLDLVWEVSAAHKDSTAKISRQKSNNGGRVRLRLWYAVRSLVQVSTGPLGLVPSKWVRNPGRSRRCEQKNQPHITVKPANSKPTSATFIATLCTYIILFVDRFCPCRDVVGVIIIFVRTDVCLRLVLWQESRYSPSDYYRLGHWHV